MHHFGSKEYHVNKLLKKAQLVPLAVMLFLAPAAFGASLAEHPGCSGNCLECHKFEKKEAEAILQKLKDSKSLPPDAKVADIKQSPVGGVWQVELEASGKKGAIFVDFSKKFLIGQIVPLESIGPRPERRVDLSRIPLKDSVVVGSPKAKKKVIVFTDPDCPYCRTLHEEMKQVVGRRKDIAFHLMLFPLPMHKDAYPKAQAILCERDAALADAAFAGKAVPAPKCGNEALERNIALARELQVNSTPTLIRGDGLVLNGALPVDQLINWIDGK